MNPCHPTTHGPMLRTHQPDCDNAACGGCQPCPETHCTARDRCHNHTAPTELTCGACIGRTRNDLAMVTTLAALMLPEAINRGINSEAANLAGPAADPEAWSWRKIAAKQGRAWHASLLEDDDDWHPYTVLGRWDLMIRDDYGPDTTHRITITRAADYLDRMLHRIANDPAQDFPLLAQEVARCRTHLEAVLHDSRVPEKGAPCPDCATILIKRYNDHDTTGASDRWTCPTCGAWWSEADYRQRVAATYIEHAEWLTATDMERVYRVPQGHLRKWAERGHVAKSRDTNGRRTYRVADVQARRLVMSRSADTSAPGHDPG